ncbi:MAG: hypothetical protein RLZZ501_983 [Pseudomonadota bacterium]
MTGKGRRAASLLVVAVLILLAGCATPRDDSLAAAARRGWQAEQIAAGPFTLFALAPARWRDGAPLTVYIEGDGYAWVNRYRLSDDPTPRRAVALDLALADPAPNLVYLARPCQYVAGAARRGCDPAYWSDARYAPEVIDATLAAIALLQRRSGATEVRLVGYSGGGTVALLAAARRPGIARVITVAGVLDVAAWVRAQEVTPLTVSLDPADFVPALAGVPQVHIVGAEDEVVPRAVAESYLSRFPAAGRPALVVVPGQGHHRGWERHWPALLARVETAP